MFFLFSEEQFLMMASVLKSKLCLQVEGCFPDTMTRCAELINSNTDVDFVDINSGCPIDLVFKKVNPLSAQGGPIQINVPLLFSLFYTFPPCHVNCSSVTLQWDIF